MVRHPPRLDVDGWEETNRERRQLAGLTTGADGLDALDIAFFLLYFPRCSSSRSSVCSGLHEYLCDSKACVDKRFRLDE